MLAFAKREEAIESHAPVCSFKMLALQQMTQANHLIMRRMLEALNKNLGEEQELLNIPLKL